MDDMSLEHLPDVTATQLLWRHQVAALPRSLYHAVRRLLRLDARFYLAINDVPVARFVSEDDSMEFMRWLHGTHSATFDYGFGLGKESVVAKYVYVQADAGDSGPA